MLGGMSGLGDMLGGIDIESVMRLMSIMGSLNESDKNTTLLQALRPHLRKENRRKCDEAARLAKMMKIISAINNN